MLMVTGTTTSDFEDARIGAKVRFTSETASRPAMAVRFWTKLPNARNESGLGMDTTDFNFACTIGKTVQSMRVVGNIGFAILGIRFVATVRTTCSSSACRWRAPCGRRRNGRRDERPAEHALGQAIAGHREPTVVRVGGALTQAPSAATPC